MKKLLEEMRQLADMKRGVGYDGAYSYRRLDESSGDDVLYYIFNWGDFQYFISDLEDDDEQTAQLALKVYGVLRDRLKLSRGEREALRRLHNSYLSKKKWKPAMHRNNIFKAAHSLGMKLPSHSF